MSDWFEALAISSSVPYRVIATAEQMRAVFLTGIVPAPIEPHVERVFVELPIEMVARAAEQLPDAAWPTVAANLHSLAKRWDAEERICPLLHG